MSQPDVWAEALAAFDAQDRLLQSWLEASAFNHVIVTGCGSTYYLALTAARLLRQAGCHALACPASELLLHPQSIYLPGQRNLLLCVSRSGATSETVRAQQLFKSQVGGPVIAVTCEGGSPLVQDADLAIAIDAAQAASVAQTRSFSSMLVVVQQLSALIAGHDLAASHLLPAICRRLLEGTRLRTVRAGRGPCRRSGARAGCRRRGCTAGGRMEHADQTPLRGTRPPEKAQGHGGPAA